MANKPWFSAEFLLSVVTLFRKDKRRFPSLVESFLAWLFSISLASFYGLRFLISTKTKKGSAIVPLATTSRNETSPETSLPKLQKILASTRQKKNEGANTSENMSNEEVIKLLRGSLEARQLASVAMKNMQASDDQPLLQQLKQIWPELLKLPPVDDRTYAYEITLVVPAYREEGSTIQSNLKRALKSCQEPTKVQVVLVDAGKNTDINKAFQMDGQPKKWGDTKVVSYTAGGGRGPTLNFGAKHGDGKLLTFLHSDNILPDDWDVTVKSLLFDNEGKKTNNISCAFSFLIHTKEPSYVETPGIAAAQWLGTIRTEWFHTIYGDSVFSFPASTFRYIGGYPEQALMEDYEMMDLLRKRVASLKGEELCIHPSPTLIHPRRWQTRGVTYVTLFNFLCVYLYENRGWSPQELYNFYYGNSSG